MSKIAEFFENQSLRDVKEFQLQQCLNQLKIEMRNVENWQEKARETMYTIQEIIFDINDGDINARN